MENLKWRVFELCSKSQSKSPQAELNISKAK
jgi:hypothetical protein